MSAIKEESESIKHGVFIKHELPDVGEFTAEQYKVQDVKQETTHVSIQNTSIPTRYCLYLCQMCLVIQ